MPKTAARKEKSPASREKLLVAAEQIVVTEGLRSLTTRHLAARSKVNTSLIVYNFGSLDGLIEELFRANCEQFNNARAELLAALPPAERSLKNMMRIVVQPILLPPAYCRQGRSASVIEQIYAHASAEIRARSNLALKDSLVPLIELIEPMVPHLSRDKLLWRLSLISSAAMGMVINPSLWGAFGLLGLDVQSEEQLHAELFDFALHAIS